MQHKPFLSTAFWLTIPMDVRVKLVKLFSIPRTGGSKVEQVWGQTRVVSDGHTSTDLMAINLDILQKMLKTTSTDYYALLNTVIASVDKFLEIKDSGVVDKDWNFTQGAVVPSFDEDGIYKTAESLGEGDRVRIKDGVVYRVAKPAGRPKKHAKETEVAA